MPNHTQQQQQQQQQQQHIITTSTTTATLRGVLMGAMTGGRAGRYHRQARPHHPSISPPQWVLPMLAGLMEEDTG